MEITISRECPSRVKSICFHPHLPVLAVGLYNGHLFLWDWEKDTVLSTVHEPNDVPVRSVDFDTFKNILVTGCDDYCVRLWDTNTNDCLFTFIGHLDFIRSVQFHHSLCWILSASDDETLRIWDHSSKICLCVVRGHSHCIMSASFHPRYNLILSASLDNTVKVWNFSGLQARVAPTEQQQRNHHALKSLTTYDVVEACALAGHTKGVGVASFHPTLPLIASGADDRTVKLWRLGASSADSRLVANMRGHMDDVTCIGFPMRYEVVISAAKDRTVRVWCLRSREALYSFRSTGRVWCLAVQFESTPNEFGPDWLATGSDEGIAMFSYHDLHLSEYGSAPILSDYYDDDISPANSLLLAASVDASLAELSSLESGAQLASKTNGLFFSNIILVVLIVGLWQLVCLIIQYLIVGYFSWVETGVTDIFLVLLALLAVNGAKLIRWCKYRHIHMASTSRRTCGVHERAQRTCVTTGPLLLTFGALIYSGYAIGWPRVGTIAIWMCVWIAVFVIVVGGCVAAAFWCRRSQTS